MRVRFDEFLFDSERRELTRGGTRVHVSPKALLLLEILLSERPKVISKTDLQSRLWPDVVVEEANLTNLISELRGALNDDPRRPRCIRTAHGYGYGFLPEVADTHSLPPAQASHARPAIAAAAWTVIIGVTMAAFFIRARSTHDAATIERIPRRQSVERLPLNWLGVAAVSPDRRFVAYSTRGLPHTSIRLRHLDSGAEFDLIPPDRALYLGHLKFSPDGNWVYYLRAINSLQRYDELRRTPALGGPSEIVIHLPGILGTSYALSPDGTRVAFIRQTSDTRSVVVVANEDGSNPRVLASFQEAFCCSMSWSPDGTKLLLPVSVAPKLPFNLVTIDTTSSAVERLLCQPPIFFADWTTDGRGFVAVTGDNNLKYFSYPDLRSTSIEALPGQYAGVYAVDRATLLAIALNPHSSLWALDLDKAMAVDQVTTGEENFDGGDGLTWTPDDRIVYSGGDSAGNSASLRMCNGDGSAPRQLTRAPAHAYHVDPSVSADGQMILFAEERYDDSERLISSQLFRIRSDGSDLVPLTQNDEARARPFFTSDGKFVLFTANGDLKKMPAEGGASILVREDCTGIGIDPRDWIACRTKSGNVLVISLEDGQIRWKGNIRGRVRWTSDGDLSYVKGRPSNIIVEPIDGRSPKQVTNFGAGLIQNFAWSRHGHRIAMARRIAATEAYLMKNVSLPNQSR